MKCPRIISGYLETGYALYSIRTDGSRPPVLLHTISNFGLSPVQFSPDNVHVVYWDHDQHYSSPLDGSEGAVKLADNARLAVLANERFVYISQDRLHVYSTPISACSPVLLSPQDNTLEISNIELSHDARHVVFTAANKAVYCAAVDGSAEAVLLHADEKAFVFSGGFSPDDLYCLINQEGLLYRVPIDGSAPLQPLGPSGKQIGFTDEGERVVLSASEVFSLSMVGEPVRTLSEEPLYIPRIVTQYDRTTNNNNVIFSTRHGVNGETSHEVFAVPVDGSAAERKISVGNSHAYGFHITREISTIFLRGNSSYGLPEDLSSDATKIGIYWPYFERGNFRRGLWQAPYAQGRYRLGTQTPDSPDEIVICDGPYIPWYKLTGDNYTILFYQDGALFTLPVDGSLPPAKISGVDVVATWPDVSFDNAWAAYTAADAIYTAPLDGHVAPIALAEHVAVEHHGFSPDNAWLVYKARMTLDSLEKAEAVYDLYGAPVTGGVAPVVLARNVGGMFQISMDSKHVVCTSGGRLCCAGLPRAQEEPAILSDVDTVSEFRLDEGSEWAVYMASIDGVNRLFSCRLDGSLGPVPLCDALPDSADMSVIPGDWLPFAISPEGDWVSFRAYEGDVYTLYGVPIAGGPMLQFSLPETRPDGPGLWVGPHVVYRDIRSGKWGGGLYGAHLTGAPNAVISRAADQPETADALPVRFEVMFDEAVNGVDAVDFVNAGTAAEVTFAVVEIARNRYALAAVAAGSGGTIIPRLLPDTIVNDRGASNSAGAQSSASVLLTLPVPAPNVVGMTQAEAEAALAAAGLTAGTVTQAYSATVPAGQVMEQEPAPGTLVEMDSSVNLVLSAGPEPVAVPSLAGVTQDNLAAALAAAGLVLGEVTQEYSATVPAGQVIRQEPSADAVVAPGTAIHVWISSGVAPVAVPDVVGMTREAAQAALTQAGLTLGVVTQVFSETVPAGVVISQSPGAGSAMPAGGAVALTVSRGVVVATGSLQVTILPQAAIDAGAQWRVDGGAWRASGAIVTELTPGAHVVEFSDTGGDGAIGCVNDACTCFITPEAMNADIAAGETAVVTATYENKGTADDAGISAIVLTILLLLFRSRKGRNPEDEA